MQSLYPANNGRNAEVMPLINVTFDEEVVASSYQPTAITLTRTTDNASVPLRVQAALIGGQTVLHLVPGAVLSPNSFYRLTLPAGMADRFGNAVANARNITFQTGGVAEDRTFVETFEGTFTDNWWQPAQSGSTTLASVVADSTSRSASSIGNPVSNSTKSMEVRFGFKTDASSWLIREYLNSGPAYNARFDTSYTLQTYIYGDGSGTLFRFAVDDGCTGASACAGSEVSPWTAVTWRGWRKVEWDLGTTAPGTWIGNGVLEGQLRVDSYQLSYAPGGAAYGRLLFDDLAVVKTRDAHGHRRRTLRARRSACRWRPTLSARAPRCASRSTPRRPSRSPCSMPSGAAWPCWPRANHLAAGRLRARLDARRPRPRRVRGAPDGGRGHARDDGGGGAVRVSVGRGSNAAPPRHPVRQTALATSMRPAFPDLPVRDALPALLAALAGHPCAVLVAPPGAGKTTLVPLALLDAPWRADGRVIVLEPRRLAARAAAARMAHLLGERVGETVGYRVRMDAAVTARTRVEVVTEGILTRMLQDDPGLEGVAALLFDEFHERSLHADLGLALALDAQAALRPDLRLLVMSATLDAERIARFLGTGGVPAPVVQSEGRMYPVETHFLSAQEAGDRAARPAERLARLMPKAIAHALRHEAGDVLAFLPGLAEIRRVEERLAPALPPGAVLHVLHGDLPLEMQDAAVRPAPAGTRKVVLATSLAESSLTIEGVRVVVDGGYSRVPRFSARTGLTTLATVPVTHHSADQRRGRAGRLGPGVCYRLWTKADDARLAESIVPEILEADLAPLALELALWGARDATALRWLDAPPPAALARARALLLELGALAPDGAVTPQGRALAALGVHPRLGHLVREGQRLGLGATACLLAALLAERDVLPGGAGPRPPDLRLRLDLVARASGGPARKVSEAARALMRRARMAPTPPDGGAAGLLTAFAYPDRIAQVEAEGRVRLASGQRAALDPGAFPGAAFLAVAHLDGPPHAPRVALAAPLTLADIEAHFGTLLRETEVVAFDAATDRVVARRRRTLGALVLHEGPLAHPDPALVAEALLGEVAARGLAALPWTKDAERLRARLAFLHHHDPGAWPEVSEAALLGTLPDWLGPHVHGMRALADLARLDLCARLLDGLPWPQRAALDRLAPSHVDVPSGSHLPLDYSDPEAPVLAVRLQEVFGLLDTPRVLDGRVPVVLHLLSPAHRPAQVTRDLRSFWQSPATSTCARTSGAGIRSTTGPTIRSRPSRRAGPNPAGRRRRGAYAASSTARIRAPTASRAARGGFRA